MAKTDITAEFLREILDYNPDTGVFIWKQKLSDRIVPGKVAGGAKTGSVRIGVLGTNYLAHRLVWLYVTGEWPKHIISHINGNLNDNRFCNLRDIPKGQNMAEMFPRYAGELTQDILKEYVSYSEDTGLFERIKCAHPTKWAGKAIGHVDHYGYVVIRLPDGKIYKAHRLAWLYVHGRLPPNDLDHINGIPSDNRICNLRDATRSENRQNIRQGAKNSSHGFLGVSVHKNRWQASITVNGVSRTIGSFKTPELAHAAYIQAKREMHPFCQI